MLEKEQSQAGIGCVELVIVSTSNTY